MPSWKAFYLATRTSLTRPWRFLVRNPLLGHTKLSYSGMRMPTMSQKDFYLVVATSLIQSWRCQVEKPSTWLRRHLSFSHDDVESKSLLLNRDNAFDSVRTNLSRKAFYSAVETSLIRPWWNRVGKCSGRPPQRLLFGHDEAESENILLSCHGIADLAMAKASKRLLELAATMSLIRPWWCQIVKSSTR